MQNFANQIFGATSIRGRVILFDENVKKNKREFSLKACMRKSCSFLSSETILSLQKLLTLHQLHAPYRLELTNRLLIMIVRKLVKINRNNK